MSTSKNELRTRAVLEAWNHLSTTRTKSATERACMYGGSGCAIAPLLEESTRDELDPEPGTTDDVIGASNIAASYFKRWVVPLVGDFFLGEIQEAHDDCESAEGTEFVDEVAERLWDVCEADNNVEAPQELVDYGNERGLF